MVIGGLLYGYDFGGFELAFYSWNMRSNLAHNDTKIFTRRILEDFRTSL